MSAEPILSRDDSAKHGKKASAKKHGGKHRAPRKPRLAKPRQQYGVLALRRRGDSFSMMLVTSRGTRRWIIPKGNPEKGKTGAQVAAMEAFEEAGLLGEVWNTPIGQYLAPKHLTSGRIVEVAIQVYRMDVDQVLDDWPEKGQRMRGWYSLDEAAMLVGEGGLVALILELNAQLIRR